MVYGLAFAIARQENPWEAGDTVAKRALDAAKIAYEHHGGWDVHYLTDRQWRPVPEKSAEQFIRDGSQYQAECEKYGLNPSDPRNF
jgi:hypothetical protein